VAVLGCDFLLIAVLRKRVASIIASLETPGHDLATLSLVLERLERESFETPYLRQLRASIDVEELPASKRIAQLQRWVATVDSSDHILIRAVGPMLLWREQLAMGVEAWRAQAGAHVGAWLRAVAELEALSSLASLSFEHPDWSFPILADQSSPLFEGMSLKHPLLPSAKCVPNDVSLGSPAGHCDLVIVSGSNMSGKSTLLRSIGLNTVLAWAGAPVAAQRLRVSAMQIGASLRVVDSLQDGRSRFMAEITRLRQIVGLTESGLPVLFLLDELLSGTNSHDRRIGASAIVYGLLERGAIGLITTHDLALADLEKNWESKVCNMHFEDVVRDGRIEFDYRLRPGVVVRSNALELMRAVGLKV
jgi:DNA mismatch repair ATPase MutS